MTNGGNSAIQADLAIIGGGIAGPALAAALADSGYRIVLIERSPDPLDTARGDHLQPISCEHLQQWGALDRLLARGAERRLGSRWQRADGELVLDARIDNLPIPHPYFLYLNHELISEVLLARAAENAEFTMLRPATAKVVRDSAGPGEHGLVVEQDSTTTRIDAHCIAIADGRSSRNRKALAIDAAQHNYTNPLLIMFAPRTFQDTRNDVHVYLTGNGIVSVVPRINEQWKIGFPVARADLATWNKATPAELSQRLSDLVPALDGIQPTIAGIYPVAMINAPHWVNGNCVLLGDACHALHPGRSQGMNIAIRNVATLAGLLQAANIRQSPASVRAVLQEYEDTAKPAIDERLQDNHARGLDMDHLSRESVERTQAAMQQLATSPDKLRDYCMNAAGY